MRSLTFCVVACLSASSLLAQGLGAAARKEQERRKKNAEANVQVRTVGDAELLSATEGKGTFSVADENETASQPPSLTGSGVAAAPASSNAGTSPELPGTASSPRVPSELERLNEKAAAWRAKYRAAKEKVDTLEREVAELERENSRIALIAPTNPRPIRDAFGNVVAYEGTQRDSNVRHGAERVRDRLPRAQEELARARDQLSSVQEGARRAGVASGQLY